FTYRASDGEALSAIATVQLTVTAVNDAPVAVDSAFAVNEDATLNVAPRTGVLVGAQDAEGDVLRARLVRRPSHGRVTLNHDGSFSYVPNANYNGGDSFLYVVGDGRA